LEAIHIGQSGRQGDLRIVQSVVWRTPEGSIRLAYGDDQGSGPLFDMGVYPINAARHLFRDEPVEVAALAARNDEGRFKKVEEMIGVMLRFPQERLASFTVSFGAAAVSRYVVFGPQACWWPIPVMITWPTYT
jgi:glucose-fructose oxidoreductase